MDGWLITWCPAGHDRIDQVVTILPEYYSVDEVTVILRALFFVGTFTLREALAHLPGGEMSPHVRQSRHANDYLRLVIELGSDAMEARVARRITVTEDRTHRETITWQEQMHAGDWKERSFTRKHDGSITFDVD